MAVIDVLKHLDFSKLNDDQRVELTKRLRKHQRDLQSALKSIETGLDQLEQAAKPTPPATPTRTRRSPKR